jgi:hypothetical protein
MSHKMNRPGRGGARHGARNATSKAQNSHSSYRELVSRRSTGKPYSERAFLRRLRAVRNNFVPAAATRALRSVS